MSFVKITGVGAYVPELVVSNQQLADEMNRRLRELATSGQIDPSKVDDLLCSADWIEERTGITERRIARPDQATSDLAVEAIRRCLQRTGYRPMDRSGLVFGTVMGDYPSTPTTAAIVQHKMGWPVRHPDGRLVNRILYDTTAACTSFGAVLMQADSLVRSENRRGVIAVGADVMSRLAHPLSRGIAPILADGAFAINLEATSNPSEDCFLPEGKSFFFGGDGQYANLIITQAGGTAQPITSQMRESPLCWDPFIHMNGREVFKIIVRLVRDELIVQALANAGLDISDIGCFFFHQANLRMIDPITDSLGITQRTFNNIERLGNTTSAAIGNCVEEAALNGILKPGMLVMMVVFGGGFTWGTVILKWPELDYDI